MDDLYPTPDLTPQEVIALQLRALQHNDDPTPNCGISTAFRFASPANRVMTGPLERFIDMLKNSMYGDILNFRSAHHGPLVLVKQQAFQRVELVTTAGAKAVFVFGLSQQADAPFAGCWMTDTVVRLPYVDPRLN